MPTPADAAGSFAAATSAEEDVVYPSSDGQRMAENTWQGDAIIAAASDLQVTVPADALVAADVLVYPEEGNNRKRRAPDVLVAQGVGAHYRMSYFVWEEGKPPDWVLEVASQSTNEKDLGDMLHDYLAMGVPEYWLFDPKGDQLPRGMPLLQGLELADGEYRPLEWQLEDGVRMIHSKALGLGVYADGDLLRFWDPATRKAVLHHGEAEAIAVQAEAREAARANREAAARSAAEARVAELEAELRRLRADHPS